MLVKTKKKHSISLTRLNSTPNIPTSTFKTLSFCLLIGIIKHPEKRYILAQALIKFSKFAFPTDWAANWLTENCLEIYLCTYGRHVTVKMRKLNIEVIFRQRKYHSARKMIWKPPRHHPASVLCMLQKFHIAFTKFNLNSE